MAVTVRWWRRAGAALGSLAIVAACANGGWIVAAESNLGSAAEFFRPGTYTEVTHVAVSGVTPFSLAIAGDGRSALVVSSYAPSGNPKLARIAIP